MVVFCLQYPPRHVMFPSYILNDYMSAWNFLFSDRIVGNLHSFLMGQDWESLSLHPTNLNKHKIVLYYFGTLKSKRPLVIIFTPHLCTGMGTFSSQLESFIPSPHHQFGNETVCVVVKTCTWRQGYCNESVVSWSQLCSNNLPGRCPVQMKQVIRSRFALGWIVVTWAEWAYSPWQYSRERALSVIVREGCWGSSGKLMARLHSQLSCQALEYSGVTVYTRRHSRLVGQVDIKLGVIKVLLLRPGSC